MNQHTPGKKPDWENVPRDERNIFQHVAAHTYGLVTPGNILTLLGYLVTKSGYNSADKGNTGRALIKVGKGRLCDVLDGVAADKTGTKSPQGEMFDAIVDKKLMFDGLDIMGRKQLAPKSVVRIFGALSVANTISATEAKRKDIEMHSSKSGKIATFLKWVALVGYMSSRALEEHGNKKVAANTKLGSGAVAATAIGLGAYAAHGYFKQAFMNEAPALQDSQYVESEGSNYSPDNA